MIRVQVIELSALGVEAVLRPVSTTLSAITPAGRNLEELADSEMTARLEAMGELPIGAAVITPAPALPCSFVIHAVLQSASEPITERSVRMALLNGLRRAREWGVRELALPPLGTGAGNFDVESSAQIVLPLLREHLGGAEHPSELVVAVTDDYEAEAFSRVLTAVEVGTRTPPPEGDVTG